jgi:hypothetical protein
MPDENKKLRYFQFFLRFLKVLSVLTLLLNIAACCMIMKGTAESSEKDLEKAFSFLAQSGFIVICILLVLAEFEPKWFIRVLYLFHYWLGRGFGLLWMGVQCINSGNQAANAITDTAPSISPDTLKVIGQVVGWTLISVGLIYVMMSLLCLRSMLGVDEGADLDVRLLGEGSTDEPPAASLSSSTSYDAAERRDEAELLANAALAMGMSEKELRRKFLGKNGAREAQAHFASVKSKMEQLEKLAASSQAVVSQASKGKYESAAVVVASATAPPPSSKEVAASAPPPSDRRFTEDDDDDLERAYYNNSTN